MASPVVSLEIRYRVAGSDLAWTVESFAPGAKSITLRGLERDGAFEGAARSIGKNGRASDWTPVSFTVATTARTGPLALPPVTIGNVSSRWVAGTAVSYTATDTAATVSVTAGLLQVGDTQVSFGASSAVLTGTASEVRTVHLYYDDPRIEGGSRTLGVTTDKVASMAEYGRIYIASLIVTFDTVGGTGTGGGGDIGGGGGGSGEFPTNPV